MTFVMRFPLGVLDGLEQRSHHVRLEEDQKLGPIRQFANLPTHNGKETLGSMELETKTWTLYKNHFQIAQRL